MRIHTDDVKFRVELVSRFGEGVISSPPSTGDLEDIIRNTEASFKKENNSTEVEADCFVFVYFSEKLQIPIPRMDWEKCIQPDHKSRQQPSPA